MANPHMVCWPAGLLFGWPFAVQESEHASELFLGEELVILRNCETLIEHYYDH